MDMFQVEKFLLKLQKLNEIAIKVANENKKVILEQLQLVISLFIQLKEKILFNLLLMQML